MANVHHINSLQPLYRANVMAHTAPATHAMHTTATNNIRTKINEIIDVLNHHSCCGGPYPPPAVAAAAAAATPSVPMSGGKRTRKKHRRRKKKKQRKTRSKRGGIHMVIGDGRGWDGKEHTLFGFKYKTRVARLFDILGLKPIEIIPSKKRKKTKKRKRRESKRKN